MPQNSRTDEIKKLFTVHLEEYDLAFIFLGLSGVIIRANKTILVDPANLLNEDELNILKTEGIDLLIFTHNHGDHYSSKDTLNIFNATGTPILAEPLVAADLTGKILANKLTSALAGQTYTFDDIIVKVIRGIHRGPINLYQIKIGNVSIFHAGDSGYVPVKNYQSDIAFLPTGSPSPTASPQDAYNTTLDLKPNVIVTMHGSADQNRELEVKIKEKMSGTSVIIPEPYILKVVKLLK